MAITAFVINRREVTDLKILGVAVVKGGVFMGPNHAGHKRASFIERIKKLQSNYFNR